MDSGLAEARFILKSWMDVHYREETRLATVLDLILSHLEEAKNQEEPQALPPECRRSSSTWQA